MEEEERKKFLAKQIKNQLNYIIKFEKEQSKITSTLKKVLEYLRKGE